VAKMEFSNCVKLEVLEKHEGPVANFGIIEI